MIRHLDAALRALPEALFLVINGLGKFDVHLVRRLQLPPLLLLLPRLKCRERDREAAQDVVLICVSKKHSDENNSLVLVCFRGRGLSMHRTTVVVIVDLEL